MAAFPSMSACASKPMIGKDDNACGARPPFAADRLKEIDAQRRIDHRPTPRRDGHTPIIRSPLVRIGRSAARIPSPRPHWHCDDGVLAPNVPLRPALTARTPRPVATEPEPLAPPAAETVADDPVDTIRHSPARDLWAILRARIDEAFLLIGPPCGAYVPMAVRT